MLSYVHISFVTAILYNLLYQKVSCFFLYFFIHFILTCDRLSLEYSL